MRKKSMKASIVCGFIALLLSVVLAACGSSPAQPGAGGGQAANGEGSRQTAAGEATKETAFPTKEIRFIVPVSPGGGMDTSARMLAKYWEKYLGKKIIVENIPGAEYNNGIFAMLKEKADGHTILTLPGVNANQLLMADVDYDLTEFDWIGRISESVQVAVVSKNSGIQSFADLQQRESVKAGVTGLSSSQTIGQLLSLKEFGVKPQLIKHQGATEAILSVIRGDAEWTTAPDTTIIPYIQNGDVIPLYVASEERLEELPDTPTLVELGQEKVVKIVGFHRIVGTNPGTPPEVLEKLRETFKQAVEDPEFVAEYSKLGTPPSYLAGEETAELVKEQLDFFAQDIDYIKSFQ